MSAQKNASIHYIIKKEIIIVLETQKYAETIGWILQMNLIIHDT